MKELKINKKIWKTISGFCLSFFECRAEQETAVFLFQYLFSIEIDKHRISLERNNHRGKRDVNINKT